MRPILILAAVAATLLVTDHAQATGRQRFVQRQHGQRQQVVIVQRQRVQRQRVQRVVVHPQQVIVAQPLLFQQPQAVVLQQQGCQQGCAAFFSY